MAFVSGCECNGIVWNLRQCGGIEALVLWDYVENWRIFSAVIEQNLAR